MTSILERQNGITDMSDDLNTCQRAFAILAARSDAATAPQGWPPRLEIRRRIAMPGELSDGTRAFIVKPCANWRWLTVTLGWDTLAELDHRLYWERPQDLARAVLDVIDHRALTYRDNPGPAPGARQLDLF